MTGQALRAIRQYHGLKLREVAEHLPFGLHRLYQIERDAVVPLDRYTQVVAAIDAAVNARKARYASEISTPAA